MIPSTPKRRVGLCDEQSPASAITETSAKSQSLKPLMSKDRRDVCVPPITRSDICRIDNPLDSVDVHRFLRRILEDEYSFKERRADNRFCVFFAHLLKEITTTSNHERTSALLSPRYTEELANLKLLLYEAMHCINDRFELFFDIAYNAEFFIINLLPKSESLYFYEAMVGTAQLHSSRHYGIMLSSFGQVLGFAQIRISEASEQYQKALDILKPLGDSRDLAWLYNHIGYVWFEKGIFGQAERYFELARGMLQRAKIRLTQNVEDRTVDLQAPWLRQEHILTDRTLASVLSCLGLLHSTIGNFETSISCHEEALCIRRRLYGLHPTLGQGYNNLCLAYERSGKIKKALDYARKGLHIKEMLVTRNSNTVLVSLLNVAHMTYHYDGSPTKALSLLDDAFNIRQVLGLKHHLTSVIWMYRGKMQLNLEKYDQAAESFRNAVDGLRQTEGHPRLLAETLRNWGICLKNVGNLAEAEQRLRQSLKVIEKVAKDNSSACEDEDNLKDTLKELMDVRTMIQSRIKAM